MRTQKGVDRSVLTTTTPSCGRSRPCRVAARELGSLQVTDGKVIKLPGSPRALRRGERLGPHRRFTMKIAVPTLIAAVAAAGVVFTTPANTMEGHTSVSPQDIKWGTAPAMLAPGAEAAVLARDPGKEGRRALRISYPARYSVRSYVNRV